MKNNMVKYLIGGLALVVLAVIIVVAATGKKTNDNMSGSSTKSTSTSASSKAVSTNAVAIQNFAFSPAVITVKVGTAVTWTNSDAVNHSVTGDTADGPKSDLFTKGGTYTYTFSKSGTFTYHCTPHPYMKGTVIVTN